MSSRSLAMVIIIFYVYVVCSEVEATKKKDFDDWGSDRICELFEGTKRKHDADSICKKAVKDSTGGYCDSLLVKLDTDTGFVEEQHLIGYCKINDFTFQCVALADADNKAITFSYEHGRRLCYNGLDPITF